MLSEQEVKVLGEKGISVDTIKKQIAHFEKGFPFIDLEAPATPENGIIVLADSDEERLLKRYEEEAPDIDLIKFVPASGAASRMFSHLFALLDELQEHEADPAAIYEDPKHKAAMEFIRGISNFAFYEELGQALSRHGHDLRTCIEQKDYRSILHHLLSPNGLSYASLPKGLLSFHRYGQQVRKAAEEHLVEGALYAKNSKHEVHLHFTLSPEHIGFFENLMNKAVPLYEKEYGVKYFITHSIQDPATDVIAVDMQNKPFRDKSGQLVFRPGGHGALINNLNKLEADLIFIKNIDNVVPDRLKAPTVRYKQLLGGLLLELREKIYTYLEQLDDANLTQAELNTIKDFCTHQLMLRLPDNYGQFDMMEQVDYLYSRLNRPIRVCGMVKNEGEPGGGPFWVNTSEGETDLQIVESSQIDLKDPAQAEIFKGSTHFNPVDLVCCPLDFRGNKFDLEEFIDPETGFISMKTKDGQPLKAQELPGLWNGAMAYWLTIFVEVPVITFNPVKTVNDLLRETHREQ